jgi:hypothetical protein
MDFIEGLRKIENRKLTLLLMVVFTITCPGVLIVYIVKPTLFFSLSSVKLMLLAISCVAPIYLINQFVLLLSIVPMTECLMPNFKDIEEALNSVLIVATCMATLLVLLFPLAYKIMLPSSPFSYLHLAISFQILQVVSIPGIAFWIERKKRGINMKSTAT